MSAMRRSTRASAPPPWRRQSPPSPSPRTPPSGARSSSGAEGLLCPGHPRGVRSGPLVGPSEGAGGLGGALRVREGGARAKVPDYGPDAGSGNRPPAHPRAAWTKPSWVQSPASRESGGRVALVCARTLTQSATAAYGLSRCGWALAFHRSIGQDDTPLKHNGKGVEQCTATHKQAAAH